MGQSRKAESKSEIGKVKGLFSTKGLGQVRKEESESGERNGQLSRQSFGQHHQARNRTTPTGQKRALNQKGRTTTVKPKRNHSGRKKTFPTRGRIPKQRESSQNPRVRNTEGGPRRPLRTKPTNAKAVGEGINSKLTGSRRKENSDRVIE